MIAVLGDGKVNETDAVEIRRSLDQAQISNRVDHYVVVTEEDSTGDPAIRIWVILKDAYGESQELDSDSTRIERRIFAVLRESGVESWPYVHFRTKTEQEEMDQEDMQ